MPGRIDESRLPRAPLVESEKAVRAQSWILQAMHAFAIFFNWLCVTGRAIVRGGRLPVGTAPVAAAAGLEGTGTRRTSLFHRPFLSPTAPATSQFEPAASIESLLAAAGLTRKRPVASGGKRRVLIMAETITLAHFVRSTILARALARDYDVLLAADPRYDKVMADAEGGIDQKAEAGVVHRLPLTSISPAAFNAAIESGTAIYPTNTLVSYVEDDVRLMRAVKPDVVIGDFRLSLPISATLCRVPFINLCNAGWSPYAKIPFTVGDFPVTRWLGVTIAQFLWDVLHPRAFVSMTQPFHETRARFGLPPVQGDLQVWYTSCWAQATLYADLPSVVPLYDAPPTHTHLGPLLWQPKSESHKQPDWLDRLPSEAPIIYIALGSSGKQSSLSIIVESLARTFPHHSVVVSCDAASSVLKAKTLARSNVYVWSFLPSAEWCARACLVVTNGGSPGCYDALAHGAPVLGVPANVDQHLNMNALSAAGAARIVRSDGVSDAAVIAAAEAILGSSASASGLNQPTSYVVAAKKLGVEIRQLQSNDYMRKHVTSVIERLLTESTNVTAIREEA